MAGKTKKSSRGMTGTVKRGMQKKDLERGNTFGDTFYIKKGDSGDVQFFHEPDDFLVFSQHAWDEDRKWFFVPCLGDDCPLCDDESEERSRKGYQWAAQVYDIAEKKAKVLSGGKDLGNRVYYRYEKRPASFTKRVFEITKFATKPITYDVAPSEDKPVALSKIKPIDLDEWLEIQIKAYYGEEGAPKASDLDEEDDDEETWEDEEEEEEDDFDDDDDEDAEEEDDDEDDDDDDDDEEEEEEAPAKPKARAKAKAKSKSKPKTKSRK